jgi:hypothetical protein
VATPFLYLRPARDLAIEAAIVGAVAFAVNAEGAPVSARAVANIVEHHLPWCRRRETHRTLVRLVAAGRVREERTLERSLCSYALP